MPHVNSHGLEPVSVFGRPTGNARLAALLVHGRTQSPTDMFDLFVRRIDLPDVTYVAPAAQGSSWYPARFIEPVEANEPRLSDALDRLDQLSQQLVEQGFAYDQQVIIGFSQGACLSCEFVWRSKRRYRALLAFTGGLIGDRLPGLEEVQPTFNGMPVLLSGCERDPWVPAERIRQTAEILGRAGCSVTQWIDPGSEHAIRDQEIALARELLMPQAQAPQDLACLAEQ